MKWLVSVSWMDFSLQTLQLYFPQGVCLGILRSERGRGRFIHLPQVLIRGSVRTFLERSVSLISSFRVGGVLVGVVNVTRK